MHTFTLLSIFSLVETITLENLEKKHCPVWHAKCSLTVSFRGLETLVEFGSRQIQGICWSEIKQISQFKGTQKREKKGCNLGNPANAFVMATSKQLLVDQAQRLDTELVEKLVENLFGFFREKQKTGKTGNHYRRRNLFENGAISPTEICKNDWHRLRSKKWIH